MGVSKLRCKQCKIYHPREQIKKTNQGNFCSTDCISKFMAKKITAQNERKARTQHRKDKFRVKSYANKLSELQAVFNEMRRLEEYLWFQERGIKPYCISCLNELGGDQWCCGHFKTRKARPELSFDRMNTFLQHNKRCNMELSGDITGTEKPIYADEVNDDGYREIIGHEVDTVGYIEGLKYRFGEKKGNEIIDYCESHHESKKYTDDEIQALKKEWNKKIRELKKQLN